MLCWFILLLLMQNIIHQKMQVKMSFMVLEIYLFDFGKVLEFFSRRTLIARNVLIAGGAVFDRILFSFNSGALPPLWGVMIDEWDLFTLIFLIQLVMYDSFLFMKENIHCSQLVVFTFRLIFDQKGVKF